VYAPHYVLDIFVGSHISNKYAIERYQTNTKR